MEQEVRLNKFLSEAGVCSRREADRMVEKGRILVDGVPAQMGQKVRASQKIEVDHKRIQIEEEKVLLAFNKPRGIVCKKDKDNIVDYINYGKRIYPIGRLDKDSEGLILLTNQGELVDKILRGSNYHEKEYIVTVNKKITPEFLRAMGSGVPILDTVTRTCELEQIGPRTFRIILTQGLNRQIRRMCEYFGYKVTTLKRVRIMNLHIDGLEAGKYREIRPEERKQLEEMLSSAKTERKTEEGHERNIHKKNERAGKKAPGSVQGVLSGRQGDHVQRGVRRPVRHSERTGERNRNRSGRQSDR